MSIEKEFIPYEQALALKELGFDDNCLAYYNFEEKLIPVDTDFINFRGLSDGLTKSPLYQQAFTWFRDKYYLHPLIEQTQCDYRCSIVERPRIFYHIGGTFDTNSEAELACLEKLIEIVKNK